MINIWDKITWVTLVCILIFGVSVGEDICSAVGVIGLLMYSLYIKLSEQIEAIKDQNK